MTRSGGRLRSSLRARPSIAFAVGAVVLVGCSDAVTTDRDAAAVTAVTDEAGSTTVSRPSNDASTPITTVTTTTTTTATATTTVDSDAAPTTIESAEFSGDGDSEWCRVSAEMIELSDAFEAAPLDEPTTIERTLNAFVDRMQLIVFVAPEEIVDDVAMSVGAFEEVRRQLASAEYDLGAADLSALELRRPELELSSERIARYNREVCGLDPDAPSSSTVSSTSLPTGIDVRGQAIALLVDGGYSPDQAECIVTGLEDRLSTDDVLAACDVADEGAG